MKTILLAVIGISPAVLTETIWALAQGNPPVVPDEVIVLTTSAGKKALKDQLFGKDEIWLSLRQNVLGIEQLASSSLVFSQEPANVKVFTEIKKGKRIPLDSIDSLEQNNAVADGILDELWAHTEKPDNRLIISIAGGYKSMSALMMSCLSILGRTHDRVTHVLVDAPYDEAGLGFFFRSQTRQELLTRAGATVKAADAKIRLFDVPWVPFRVLFEKELKQKPASYTQLINKLRGSLPDVVRPTYRWNNATRKGVVSFGNETVELGGRPAILFDFLLQRATSGRPPFADHTSAEESLRDFLNGDYQGKDFVKWNDLRELPANLRRTLSDLRKKVPSLLEPAKGTVGLRWRLAAEK